VRRSWSLRTRLFAAIGAIVALSVAITLALGLVLTRRAVDDATLKDLDHQASLIVGEERSALSPLTHLPQLRPYLAAQHERYLLDPKVLSAQAQDELRRARSVTGSITIDGTAYYYAAHPVVSGRAFILLRPKSLTGTRWTPFVEAIVIAALAGGLLAAIAAFVLARRIVAARRPVAAASRDLAGGTHPEPVPVEGAAELATLAASFNDLAEQLARRAEAERSFLLSVSHELKTPLTAIAGYAEALRDGAVVAEQAADDDLRRGGAARPARRRPARPRPDEPHRLRRPSDARSTSAEVAPTPSAATSRRRSLRRLPRRRCRRASSPAIADADRVLQVVSNLVENALRLTPRGGEVRIVTAPGCVRVEDSGRASRRKIASMPSSASISTRVTGRTGPSAPGSAWRSSGS
jgi:two-component system sensor histidine kinase BaeS